MQTSAGPVLNARQARLHRAIGKIARNLSRTGLRGVGSGFESGDWITLLNAVCCAADFRARFDSGSPAVRARELPTVVRTETGSGPGGGLRVEGGCVGRPSGRGPDSRLRTTAHRLRAIANTIDIQHPAIYNPHNPPPRAVAALQDHGLLRRVCRAVARTRRSAGEIMSRTANRPFFSPQMLLIAALVILGAALISQGIATALFRLLF